MQFGVRGEMACCLLCGKPRRRSIARRSRAWVFAGICIVLGAVPLPAQTPPTSSHQYRAGGIAATNFDARVESVLRRITLEEKVGHWVKYSAGQHTGLGTGRSN